MVSGVTPVRGVSVGVRAEIGAYSSQCRDALIHSSSALRDHNR